MRIKKIYLCNIVLVKIFLTVSSACFAKSSIGLYVGGQLGWAYEHQGKFISYHVNKLINHSVPYGDVIVDTYNVFLNDTGLGGRIFLGYLINQYVALELGYSRFSRVNVDAKADIKLHIPVIENYVLVVPINMHTDVKVETETFDFVGKLIYPVTDHFSVYSKFGLAYINAKGKVSIQVQAFMMEMSLYTNPSVNVVYPTFGVGVNYDFNEHASIDFSWNRTQKVNPCPFPSIDLIGVGLIYHA